MAVDPKAVVYEPRAAFADAVRRAAAQLDEGALVLLAVVRVTVDGRADHAVHIDRALSHHEALLALGVARALDAELTKLLEYQPPPAIRNAPVSPPAPEGEESSE